MDIRPRRPQPTRVATPAPEAQPPVAPTEAPAPVPPIEAISMELPPSPEKPKKRKKVLLLVGLGLLFAIIGVAVAVFAWYNVQLRPVDSKSTELVKITIEPATTPAAIGELLKEEGVIRNTTAFTVYTRLTKTQNSLQAGSYRLSPGESTPEIVEHLTKGSVDTFNVTFLPGATLAENREVLIKDGYTEAEVDTAFAKTYDSPLFEGKPAGADLEGYIYGETYNFGTGATVEDILTAVFSEYAKAVADNDLVAKFQAQGLTLYEGITLASIVQRESIKGDEPQIAQVFYSRLAIDMPLGSDVTYQYIADKTGVARDTNLDSPYNTRRYTGLPPGPIAVPGLSSLLAVASPASGDYLYFLSGDDDITYYGRTLEEHEANISAHCKVKCSIL